MATRLSAAALLLALLNACATPSGVRLDTGQGAPVEYRPPTSSKPVEVDATAFEQALRQLALNAPLMLRPAQQGGLVRASYPELDADTRWQRLMSKRFGGFCKPGQRREDCVSLLDDVMGLSPWDKLGVGMALSIDPLKASRELKWATDRATTWEELEQASQRFADRVGPAVARVFVLAVTVVVSHGMTGGAALLASRLSMLPRFSEAAAVGASRVGIHLANVGQVSAVAVVGSTIVISLPATAVAMGAMGSGGNLSVKDTHIDVPRHHLSRLAPTWAEQRKILVDAVRQLDGKVSAVATNPNGAVFERTIQVKDTSGNLINLTIRWFKYADGSITINTVFVPP